MPHLDGAHTHSHGGGGTGIGAAVAVLLLAIGVAGLAQPVMTAIGDLLHAAGDLIHAVLIIAVLIVVAAIASGMGLLAWCLRRWRVNARRSMPVLPPRPVQAAQTLPEPPGHPALEQSREIHLHVHAVSPADIAAMLNGIQPDTTNWRVSAPPPEETK